MKIIDQIENQRPARAQIRRTVLLAMSLVMLSTPRLALADYTTRFEADINGTLIGLDGNELTAGLEGGALVGDETVTFAGLLAETLIGGGAAATGTIELAFDDVQHSTLTLFFADEAASGPLKGGWNVIGGTGRFQDAQGGGSWEGQFQTDITAVLHLTGVIVVH